MRCWMTRSAELANSSNGQVIIESVVDKETGQPVDNATLVIQVERDGQKGLVYEDYDFESYVIDAYVGDFVSIEVTAPGYILWKLVIRFKKPGFIKFSVELEREDIYNVHPFLYESNGKYRATLGTKERSLRSLSGIV